MLQLKALPIAPVAVPVYHPTGRMVTKQSVNHFDPTQTRPVHFVDLELAGPAIPFDPALMTEQDLRVTQSPSMGELFGLVAVPFRLFTESTACSSSLTFVLVEEQQRALMMLVDQSPSRHDEPVVAGVCASPATFTLD